MTRLCSECDFEYRCYQVAEGNARDDFAEDCGWYTNMDVPIVLGVAIPKARRL